MSCFDILKNRHSAFNLCLLGILLNKKMSGVWPSSSLANYIYLTRFPFSFQLKMIFFFTLHIKLLPICELQKGHLVKIILSPLVVI